MCSILSEYINSMAIGLERRSQMPSSDVWPQPYADITLANDFTCDYLLNILCSIFFNHNIESIASAFRTPSSLVYYMYLFSLKPKDEVEAERRRILAERMIETLSILRNGDPFMSKKSN